MNYSRFCLENACDKLVKSKVRILKSFDQCSLSDAKTYFTREYATLQE